MTVKPELGHIICQQKIVFKYKYVLNTKHYCIQDT